MPFASWRDNRRAFELALAKGVGRLDKDFLGLLAAKTSYGITR